jgi:hypothetical protein
LFSLSERMWLILSWVVDENFDGFSDGS